ncbi:MAG: hypothetical protein WKG03_22960, partial [Telluria sp.]
MQASVIESVTARVDAAEKNFDRDGAVRAAELAKQLGAPDETADNLMARARKIAQAGESVPGDKAGMVLVR